VITLLHRWLQPLLSVSGRESPRCTPARKSSGGAHVTYDEYLKHVDECERLAKSAKLPSNRISLLSTAEKSRRMASDAKPRDGAGSNPVLKHVGDH
jgi:hypothetical protein